MFIYAIVWVPSTFCSKMSFESLPYRFKHKNIPGLLHWNRVLYYLLPIQLLVCVCGTLSLYDKLLSQRMLDSH
jgi:hypothetical protein